jgi:spermidine synthase
VKKRLNPGGVATQWVPLYESAAGVVKSQLATFFGVFPHGVIFANEGEQWDSDTVVLAPLEPRPIDADGMQQRLESVGYARVKASLAEVGFNFAADLLATYHGRASDLQVWLHDAQINTDRNLRLQYLAGANSNVQKAAEIYGDLLRHRPFPDDLFIASDATMKLLREALTP